MQGMQNEALSTLNNSWKGLTAKNKAIEIRNGLSMLLKRNIKHIILVWQKDPDTGYIMLLFVLTFLNLADSSNVSNHLKVQEVMLK